MPKQSKAAGSNLGWLRGLAAFWGPWPATQILVIFAVVSVFYALGSNIVATMTRVGITPGFDFLHRSANFEIGESSITFRAGDTYLRAIAAGLLNTAKMAALGCILATILGVAVGLARLSGNPLLSGMARFYVEIVRNTPLLLQLFFWIALAHALPPPRQAIALFDCVFLTNRGVFVPGFITHNLSFWPALLVSVVLFSWIALLWQLRRKARLTVRKASTTGVLVLAALSVIGFTTGVGVSFEVPTLVGFNMRGGYSLTPEFAALLAGLTVKFSAAIAEAIRAGVLAVREGQWDAGRAIGLSDGQIMRHVVLPQALRVITPLTTSNYLDVIKDSSLAVAIGYPDLVSIANTTANTTGQAFEALLIVVIVYLALNVFVSTLMNIYNYRIALRGENKA